MTPGVARVLLREREHLVGHVDPVGGARRADALRGQDHVDAAAGAEVEHRLALVQVGDRGRVAAAERCERRRLRQLAALLGVVQRLPEVARVGLSPQQEPPPQPGFAVPSVTARADSA